MLTILTLEIFNSGRVSNKNNNNSYGDIYSGTVVTDKIKEEQLRKEKIEKLEIFFMILPMLILLSGAIIMYILEKIFLK